MGADAEEVDAQRVDVHVERSDRLHGVRVEYGFRVLVFDGANGVGDRLDRPDFVVDVDDADEGGVFTDRVLQLLEVDEPFAIDA